MLRSHRRFLHIVCQKTLCRFLYAVCVIGFFESCESDGENISDYYGVYTTREEILRLNPKLSKVLNHYATDSVGLMAAEFLIDNLPYHEGVVCSDLSPLYLTYSLFGTGKYTQYESLDSAKRRFGTSSFDHVY